MVEQRCVQTSAVYLLGPGAAPQFPAVPPPSPPSPVTPEPSNPCTPIDELDLDACAANNNSQCNVNNTSEQQNDHTSSHNSPLDHRLAAAVHVLSTEAAALASLTRLYTTDASARDAFSRAVAAITRTCPPHHQRGKLVLIGVGKSGHIGNKLTATFNSLSLPAVFLHATEAVHGDLGLINSRTDTALLITYSGKTPEITTLLPHLDPALPLVLLTGATAPYGGKQPAPSCDVVRLRPDAIVLPAPVHELETVSFGIAAPTTSTTAALAVGDALALVCAEELHGGRSPHALGGGTAMGGFGMGKVAGLFARNHPGGAIGAAAAVVTKFAPPPLHASSTSASASASAKRAATVRQIAAAWNEIPVAVGEATAQLTPGCLLNVGAVPAPTAEPTAADVLRAGYASPSGWVRVCAALPGGGGGAVVSPARIKKLRSRDLGRRVDEVPGLAVRRSDFVSVAADTTVSKAADWVREMMRASAGDLADGEEEAVCRADSIVCVVDQGECVGVLEVQELLERAVAANA